MTDIKNNIIDIPPWLQPYCEHLSGMIARGQVPQGLLIYGTPGSGRRHLALWFASRLLGIPAGRIAHLAECEVGEESEPDRVHPDLMPIQPLPEKESISVEQVRDLTAFLQLKSHQGGARVVLVWPAESMTQAAANSLLKTLEEPPAGSAIVLIATTPGRLPATVVSRCLCLRIRPPAKSTALAWLSPQDPDAVWDGLLDFAGGAPLRALALHRGGFAKQMESYASDLRQLCQREDTPVAVAKRWGSGDPELSLRWLYWQVARSISRTAVDAGTASSSTRGNGLLQNSRKQLNMRPLLERLREVEELYRNRTKAMNSDLQLSSILQRWYGDVAGGDES